MPTTYVQIVGPTVTDTFGGKYKSSLPKTIKASLEKAINASSKLEVRAAKDRTERGLGIQYKVSVTNTDKGVDVEIEVLLYNVQAGQQKLVPTRSRPAKASKEGVTSGGMDDAVGEALGAVLEATNKQAVKSLESLAP